MTTSPQGCKRVKGVVYEEEETSVGPTSCVGGASEGGPVWKTEVHEVSVPLEPPVMDPGECGESHGPPGLSLSLCVGPPDGSQCPPTPSSLSSHPPCGFCQCTAKGMMWSVSYRSWVDSSVSQFVYFPQVYPQSVLWDTYSHPDNPDHSRTGQDSLHQHTVRT